MNKFFMLLILIPFLVSATDKAGMDENKIIEIGTFNIEWFPCKEDGEMMKKYGINLRYPPSGPATDIEALFNLLKKLDIELIGVVEVVDTDTLRNAAKRYLGEHFEFIYAPSDGSQKIGFLYDSSVLELVGQAQIYDDVKLKPNSWLRPAFRGYFKAHKTGFDFHAIVTHLKAGPAGWSKREKQWAALEKIMTQVAEESGDKDIILMGDMNNVSKHGINEFMPTMDRLNYYWATSELEANDSYSNYWQPDYNEERIEGSLIDHIFISDNAKIEYMPYSIQTGGMCSGGASEYRDEAIPDYHRLISDHCPVWGSFRADVDSD